MKNKKTLILIRDKKKYFWKNARDIENIDICELYKKEFSHRLITKIRKKKTKNNYLYFGVLGDWKKSLNLYQKIIFLDSSYTKQVDPLLKKFKGEIYFFYWNKTHLDYDKAREQMKSIYKNVKIYSYSQSDCALHNLLYNTTMYEPFANIDSLGSAELVNKYDIVFGGYLSKERALHLDTILDELNELGLSYYIDVSLDLKNENDFFSIHNYEIKKNVLPYQEYIKKIKESKAILNIDKYKGMGCSLRAMEAIFNKKKYITDNKDVRKEMFYSPRNVFVLGEDDIKYLPEFLNSPYDEYDKDVLDYYRLNKWVDRFN